MDENGHTGRRIYALDIVYQVFDNGKTCFHFFHLSPPYFQAESGAWIPFPSSGVPFLHPELLILMIVLKPIH